MISKTCNKMVCLIKQGKCYYTDGLIVTNNDPDSIRIGSGSSGESICQKLSKRNSTKNTPTEILKLPPR